MRIRHQYGSMLCMAQCCASGIKYYYSSMVCKRHQCGYASCINMAHAVLCIHGLTMCIRHQYGLMLCIRDRYSTIMLNTVQVLIYDTVHQASQYSSIQLCIMIQYGYIYRCSASMTQAVHHSSIWLNALVHFHFCYFVCG